MTRILLVEDHEINREMLSRRLRRKKHEVLEAGSGEEAVEIARRNKPEVILMDMALPGINGWEATKILKETAETADIPVIGLSAHAMSGDRQRGLEAGCDEYDTKPIDFHRLLAKIESLVGTN